MKKMFNNFSIVGGNIYEIIYYLVMQCTRYVSALTIYYLGMISNVRK
jgi:hypothetical protein